MKVKFWVPGPLPGCNEYDKAARTNRYAAANLKSEWTRKVAESVFILQSHIGPLKFQRVYIYFTWIESNKKRDPDNICWAKKIVLDGMIQAGLIPNDGWGQIEGFDDKFKVSNKTDGQGVEVLVVEQ